MSIDGEILNCILDLPYLLDSNAVYISCIQKETKTVTESSSNEEEVSELEDEIQQVSYTTNSTCELILLVPMHGGVRGF